MFVGHLGVAFAAKRADPSTSLGWYMAAACLADILWPAFLLLGIERVSVVPGATAFTPLVFDAYPWSHSLVMLVLWGLLLAALARWRGVTRAGAVLVALLVVSHWVLDWITHAPDMPLWPGRSPLLGLSLWNSIPGTFLVEGALWVAGLALYFSVRRPCRWTGALVLWSLVVISTALWAMGPWSPPPPGARVLALVSLIGWLLVPWAWWSDRLTTARRAAAEG